MLTVRTQRHINNSKLEHLPEGLIWRALHIKHTTLVEYACWYYNDSHPEKGQVAWRKLLLTWNDSYSYISSFTFLKCTFLLFVLQTWRNEAVDLAEYPLKPDVARVKARRLKQVFQLLFVFPFIHTSFQFENHLTVEFRKALSFPD